MFKPWIAIATAFPQTPFSRPPTQGDLSDAVIGQQHLYELGDTLRAVVDEVFQRPSDTGGNKPTAAPRDLAWVDVLHKLWGETWTPRLALCSRARMRDKELVVLDREQHDVLDHFERNQRLLVTGGPGTGKTLLAREALRRLEKEGARVLFLCWTRALALAMRGDGVADAWAVRELAVNLLSRAAIKVQGSAPPPAWTNESWDLSPLHAAMDAVPTLGIAYDAVIVDEAQDFTSNDWELVKSVVGNRRLWGFADEGQAYWSDRTWPKELFTASCHLSRPYRCPEALAQFADQYRARSRATEEPVRVPAVVDQLRLVRAPSATSVADYVAREIEKALGDGAHPADIAVLSIAGQRKTVLCAGDRIGRTHVVRAGDPKADEHVVADTFLRFKGLERPWIIITELGLGPKQYDVRMHVALTRATVGCVIVGLEGELAGDARLAALDR